MLQQMAEYCVTSFYLSNVFQSCYRNENYLAGKQSRNGYSFHNVDVTTPFLCSSKCQQGIQGVSVCPEGTRLVRSGSQSKLFYLRVGDCDSCRKKMKYWSVNIESCMAEKGL